MIAITGLPARRIPWRQFRALGSSALSLCDVAAGNVDGFLDCLPDQHRPWDYLGGLLVCREAGAVVEDALGRDLVIAEEDGRRCLVGAGTPELLDALLAEIAAPMTGDGLDLDRLLAIALTAAEAGSAVVRDAFGREHESRAKGPGDWVSAVDVASEQAVRESLTGRGARDRVLR